MGRSLGICPSGRKLTCKHQCSVHISPLMLFPAPCAETRLPPQQLINILIEHYCCIRRKTTLFVFTSEDFVGGSWWHRPKADGFLIFKNRLTFQRCSRSKTLPFAPDKRGTLLDPEAYLLAPPLCQGQGQRHGQGFRRYKCSVVVLLCCCVRWQICE